MISWEGNRSLPTSIICSKFLVSCSLNLLVSLINTLSIVKRFQSFLIDYNKLLKKSSNSSLKPSLINIIWFLNIILCLVMFFVIDTLVEDSLDLISWRALSISDCKHSVKSRFSNELRGTTGWRRWFNFKHFEHTFF